MLRLQLLGGFRAHLDTGEVPALARQPRRAALLTFLAVERDVAREAVIALLWPEAAPDRGRHALNQGIYYLRRLLGAEWVELHGDRCVVAPWVVTDVAELERAAAAEAYEDVLRLYGGPLLAGTTLVAAAEFDIWVDARRAAIDRLHRRARRRHLADLLTAGRTREALACAEEWCRLDPLEDEAQHRYVELLAAAGQRGAALRQFGAYRRLLEEHGLKPLDETMALVDLLQRGEAGPLPAVTAGPQEEAAPQAGPMPTAAVTQAAAPAERAAVPAAAGSVGGSAPSGPTRAGTEYGLGARLARSRLLRSRVGLSAVLAAVFAVNWIETTAEARLEMRLPVINVLRLELARAAHWFEGLHTFTGHELTNRVAVLGYTASYFFIFPLLLVGVGVALARRPGIQPYRVFSLAVLINYVISLPFFLFFPVPERWWYADAGAVVLSDLWSARLIDAIRPISGLDNSFPSVHVSLTVLVVLTSFAFRLRYRWSVLFLGATVALATLVLGIHWLADVVAGAAAGVLSVAAAFRIDQRLADSRSTAHAPRASRRSATAPIALEPR
jgi:DNA-binding SARP family transcriptional activator/membrane-associated phospholipid phosphatase